MNTKPISNPLTKRRINSPSPSLYSPNLLLLLLLPEPKSTPSSTIPFDWEETPGTPKSAAENDFDFDFSGQLERASLSAADELFDGGKIKPLRLKPPPKTNLAKPILDSSKSSVLRDGSSPKSSLRDGLSPKSSSSPQSPAGRIGFFRDGLSSRRNSERERERGREREIFWWGRVGDGKEAVRVKGRRRKENNKY